MSMDFQNYFKAFNFLKKIQEIVEEIDVNIIRVDQSVPI